MATQSTVQRAANRTKPLASERKIMAAAIDTAEALLDETEYVPSAEAVALLAGALIALRAGRLLG
jgi:hypothetical protein